MSTSDNISILAKKVKNSKLNIETEEATKNALIMPFISSVLGYDVFDPSEVVPEFTADVGVKKGEKVDYAIVKNGEIQILIECKPIGSDLDLKHASQLFRYFSVTSARIAILTNGQIYQIYTDGDAPNRMDEKPFLIFDLLDIDRTLLPEIQKLSKASFDLDSVVNAAQELKYIGGIRRILASDIKNPSDEWVKYFVSRIYDGKATQKVLEQFRHLVSKATNQYVGLQVNERLKSALGDEGEIEETEDSTVVNAPSDQPAPVAVPVIDSDITTTDEELEGFNIVRAIAVAEVEVERISFRDSKNYFAVILDDNNRKPIIRLHLNGKTVKFATTFAEGKDSPKRYDLNSVVDLYKISEEIRDTLRLYLRE